MEIHTTSIFNFPSISHSHLFSFQLYLYPSVFISLKWASPGLFFVYFRPFLVTISIIQIEKSIDGVLGIRTQGRRMVGADKAKEQWRLPFISLSFSYIYFPLSLLLSIFAFSLSLLIPFSASFCVILLFISLSHSWS